MQFSIIGTGFIFPSHVEAIRHVGGKIRDIVNTARGEEIWREMVKTTDADCIVILTPNDLHFEMVNAASEAGKIVLCEKPLSLKSEELKTLVNKKNIFTVLQLKYHPLIKEIKEEMRNNSYYEIEIDISVYRDEKYYQSWKGQKERSGGILFNLGIHYFDLLIYLFGVPNIIERTLCAEKTASGLLKGENYSCSWRLSTDEKRGSQKRAFKINGADYNFSSQDNLSHENLHREIYRDLLVGRGAKPEDALDATVLTEKIYKSIPA